MSSSRAFTYMHLANIDLIEKMHQQFLVDPGSVDPSWRYFFEGVEFGEYQKLREKPVKATSDVRIFHLIDAYRRYGHLIANNNPIRIEKPQIPQLLDLKTLGFKEGELKEQFPTCGLLKEEFAPLEKIQSVLEKIYCGSIGIEYMGCLPLEIENWIQSRIEPEGFHPHFSIDQKRQILHSLNKAELFEIFLHTKYVGQKRFSLEGGETLIPMLSEMIEAGTKLGMLEYVIGMAHRGRLNVLTNILDKSYSMVFSEFEDFFDSFLMEGSSDVKYHKGYSSNIATRSGETVHISLTSNPSHLESVNPVVEGKVKAKQIQKGDLKQEGVIPILIHGDASLAGQGIVYETMQLCRVEGYSTGGTIHIVINNQIGFTTLPFEYRSTTYSTDIARSFSAVVFHMNAEDPESCIFTTHLALALRQQFHCDVFLELNCYRKYGHNESDEPSFTQPIEYQFIRQKKSIREIYRDALIQEGSVEKQMVEGLEEEFRKALHFELEDLKIKKERIQEEAFNDVWKDFRKGSKAELFEPIQTGVDLAVLKEISRKLAMIPEGFEPHSKLKRLIEMRSDAVEKEENVDWALAEYLAFAALLWEGFPVRLSGQDSQRGTFSQRHAVWIDQKTGKRYFPLSHLKEGQGQFTVYNSPLSEFGVIGFEFGYSLAYPASLVLWEAQFGDFANGGQIIFDQYLSCSEQKWRRYSGLVLLLPHGYEGQGAEHSSARLERFLQLAAETNMQITYPTTPGQYFHLLRRQMKRLVRIPLIVMTPKGLLRHPKCQTPVIDLSQGKFEEILDDPTPPEKSKRVILCTGHIYYDLLAEREKRQVNHIAIVRLEQLYPLHRDRLVQVLEKYSEASEYYWVQEEPINMGAWSYLLPILYELKPKDIELQCVARKRRAASATGSHIIHEREHHDLMEKALT